MSESLKRSISESSANWSNSRKRVNRVEESDEDDEEDQTIVEFIPVSSSTQVSETCSSSGNTNDATVDSNETQNSSDFDGSLMDNLSIETVSEASDEVTTSQESECTTTQSSIASSWSSIYTDEASTTEDESLSIGSIEFESDFSSLEIIYE